MSEKLKKNISGDSSTPENQISYQGKLKISIIKNNTVYVSRTYKNTGGLPLFKFLAHCLGGTLTRGERPMLIKLFENTSAIPPTSEVSPLTNTIERTSRIAYNEVPLVVPYYNENNIPIGYSATFHFLIPYTYIKGLDEGPTLTINEAMLYCQDAIEDDDYSALVYFIEDSDWDPLEIDTSDVNFNVAIDWTMIITNNN